MACTRTVPVLYVREKSMKHVTKHTKKRGVKYNCRKEGKKEGI
jgi:hypothetical protein